MLSTTLLFAVFMSQSVVQVDSGFVSRPPFCAEVSWPTLSVGVYHSQLSVDEEATVEDAVLYWNNIGIGALFYHFSLPPEPAFVLLPLIEVVSEPMPTGHGHIVIYYSVVTCKITGAKVYMPDNSIANEPWSKMVHILGDALGLEHDTVTNSVMLHSSNWSDVDLLNGSVTVTTDDKIRLLRAVIE